MRLMKRPQLKNEARLTVSVSHDELKKLLDGQYSEISILRSDREIEIKEADFGKLKFTPMDGGWFLCNYSACI